LLPFYLVIANIVTILLVKFINRDTASEAEKYKYKLIHCCQVQEVDNRRPSQQVERDSCFSVTSTETMLHAAEQSCEVYFVDRGQQRDPLACGT